MVSAPDMPETNTATARRVLLLDTDPGVRWALQRGLERSGYATHTVSNLDDALDALESGGVELVVLELLNEAGLTLDTLEMIAATQPPHGVICTSIDAPPQTVIEAMRRGASDFLPKPYSLSDIRSAISRAFSSAEESRPVRRLGSVHRSVGNEESLLIGISTPMLELRDALERITKTDLNCLIRGESGTGKDMVAREIHRLSSRSDQPFIKVNCTALPEHLLESELFGYEKGAFTGAVTSKPGRFELAHNGIIFLDEIGDMQANLQSKLLQVIEHKEFTKLGGTRPIRVDVQIIAATNADLELRTKQGEFRSDLYFRLNEVSLWVPSLKERKQDIPLLVRHFLQKHGRFSEGTFQPSGEDLAGLTAHDWPGNVRELESTIKRWLAMGRSVNLPGKPAHTERTSRERIASSTAYASDTGGHAAEAPPKEDDTADANQIRETLDRFQWNRRKAAEHLGLSYQTLRRRIEKYGLNR
mgnify:CR=1 FL=1